MFAAQQNNERYRNRANSEKAYIHKGAQVVTPFNVLTAATSDVGKYGTDLKINHVCTKTV